MDYIDKITGGFSALLCGLIGSDKDLRDLYEIMESNIAIFRKDNREYFERGYKIPTELSNLKKVIIKWQNAHESEHSHMDIEKGVFNTTDALFLMSEKWVDMINGYYPINPEKAIISENKQVEPQQGEQIADAKNVITERAKKYFDKAIEINYMVQTTDGYKWKWGEPKGKVRLAYFLRKIYNYDGCGKIPFKGLERLFNVSGLNTSLYQLDGALPPKWIEEIDKIFND